MASRYDIHLDGVHALDLSLVVLRDLANLLVEGTTRAARLAAEGRSQARGIPPAWLTDSAEVRLVGFREGSLAIDVTARPLADVAPDVFFQQALFGERSGHATAVDLLMDAIEDALHGRRDSDRLDAGLLQTFAETRTLFGRGSTRLRMSRSDGRSVEFDASAVKSFQALADTTPTPRVERVLGVLDSLTISARTFVVRLDDKTTLRGVAGSVPLETLKLLLGARVVVEGMVAFRPSGRAQRVEVDYAALADDRDEIWARRPTSDIAPLQIASGDLKSLFGQWPGDESDDEVFASLDEMS